ncbi:MAG: membrane protein insertion efficiency factor YidD [Planctomycetota bacterium]
MKRWINLAGSEAIFVGVAVYRGTLGQWIGGHCRFEPTCSQYMLDAVAKYGPWRGGWRGVKRILRCRPGGGCGHDPA